MLNGMSFVKRLFVVGHHYIDITAKVKHIPLNDEKVLAQDRAISVGGNAVTAAFFAAKLGCATELLCQLADDDFGKIFLDRARGYNIVLHPRRVRESSFSLILPNNGKRAMIRSRDGEYLEDFPHLEVDGFHALHLDGHMADAALHYARKFREQGILTSFDGGTFRPESTDTLLEFVDIALVSELFCEQMNLAPISVLEYLQRKGCKIGGVTLGEKGVLWYNEYGNECRLPAFRVQPERIVDTNGAGDLFRGAMLNAKLNHPNWPWERALTYGAAAAAIGVQHLGNEASMSSESEIEMVVRTYPRAEAA